MIIPPPPESYKETKLYKTLLSKNNPSNGLAEKLTCFIETVRPLQEFIISGPFKDYTLHNPNHSKKLIHIAEYIIPETTLSNLSNLELCVLMMSFYLHDLGLVVTESDRSNYINSKEFKDFITINSDYIERIQKGRDKLKEVDDSQKFDVETSVFQITEAALADFLRPLHATQEKYDNLINLIKVSAERNDLFNISGISFEKELINICISHNLSSNALIETKSIYEERYPREQVINGQILNSQYCGAILRIADILDFDKERTPKSLFNSLGIQHKKMPGYEISLKEWNKHLAVHTISINPDEIIIFGDSNHPNIEHTIKEFCTIIEAEIKETEAILRQNKAEIVQKYILDIPSIVRAKIRSIGYVYKDYSIKLNETAIVNLLMGENLYVDPQIAIRELIQNSIDACNFRLILREEGYKPQINVSIKDDEDKRKWLIVADNGIGMDEYVLSNFFFKIGNSYYNSQDFKKFTVKSNLTYFTPISRFGIGLLSVFMIGEAIQVTTKNSFSMRKDTKERKLFIDGTDSLAVVTENDNGQQGTTVEVLLRKSNDSESAIKKLYGFVKENIIRPNIPVLLEDLNNQKLKILPDNYIKLNSKAKALLDSNNIIVAQIDFEKYSKLIKGKAIFFFFSNPDESISYYDKSNKLLWGIYPLKETYLFENFLGGSRITVNGMSMKFKKIGSLYNVGKKYTSVVLDIEVKGVKEIEYDVSRDRVFGKGIFTIRREIFNSVTIGLKEIGVYEKFDVETKSLIEAAYNTKMPAVPLDQDLINKIKNLLPQDQIWGTGIHKEIAEKLDISNTIITKYITAMLHMKLIKKA